ncbi:hypothetical protein ABK040_011364 [Willaertia magna]
MLKVYWASSKINEKSNTIKNNIKFPNVNKFYLYFNKKVDDNIINQLLERIDNKKIAGIRNKDNCCIVILYNKKNKDEIINNKTLDNSCFIDKRYYNMNVYNLKMVLDRDKACKLKINDKLFIKLHNKTILNLKSIIQGIYNTWNYIIEEDNSLVIEEKDVIIKMSYIKAKKEVKYNYLIQMDNYEEVNVLLGQIIVVDGLSFKLENPIDRFKEKENNIKKNDKQSIKRNININLNNAEALNFMELNEKLTNNKKNNQELNEDNKRNNNQQNINNIGNNTPNLNNILNKLTKSNTFLYNTV